MNLFAVHLSDGSLTPDWCLLGYLVAVPLAAMGCWKLHERDVPRIALATAAFFIASSIHVPVPMTSVHLCLNGFVGILLGYRAGLSLFVGLLLQALLIPHGGMQTLGVNVVVQALPAFAVGAIFRGVASRTTSPRTLSLVGGGLAFTGVIATVLLQSSLLFLATGDGGFWPALIWIGVHIPVACVEAFIVGFMVLYIARVKPELIGVRVDFTKVDGTVSIEPTRRVSEGVPR